MRDEKGFSLIESLAALAILGLVAVAILTGLGTSTKTTTLARDRTIAESLARGELEYIRDCPYQAGAGQYAVSANLVFPASWSIAPPAVTPVHATDDGLQKVTVNVQHDGNTVLTLFTYKMNR